MRRSDRQRNSLFWQRILDATLSVVVGGFVLSVLTVATGVAPALFSAASDQLAAVPVPEMLQGDPEADRWYQPIWQEIQATWQVTTQTVGRVFSSDLLQFAQVGTGAPDPEDIIDGADVSPPRSAGVLQQAADPTAGTLRINIPLVLDAGLQVTGASTLATTTVLGAFQAGAAVFDSATVDTTLTAGAVSAGSVGAGSVTADGITTGTLSSGAVAADNMAVSGPSELATVTATAGTFDGLSVIGATELTDLLVSNAFSLQGLFTARGGIVTEDADIDAGLGEIFASNIVNQIIAGENITITGTQNEPIIGVDTDDLVGVLSINDETGEVTLTGGIDIIVSGTQIRNTSNLASVRSRGGCTDCITDADVRSDLTISGGRIDATPIGSTTPSTGRFTEVLIGTSTATTALAVGGDTTIDGVLDVEGSATSTFQGSINIVDGCLAIGGVCVEGIAPSSYVGLTDTPGDLLAGALQFADATGDNLIQSEDLVFLDGRLGIGVGTSTPSSTLTVIGDAEFSEGLVVGDTLSVASSTDIGGVLSVSGGATSTFMGSIDVIGGGCVAVNGECLISGVDELADLQDVSLSSLVDGDFLRYSSGAWRNASTSILGLGDGTYTGLSDTPEEILPNAIQFGDNIGNILTQSAEFVFTDAGRLGIGTSTPSSTLTVIGDAAISAGLVVGDTFSVEGGATSTFAGSINVVDGCFAIDGECIVEGVDQLADLSDVSLGQVDPLAANDLLIYTGSDWINVSSASLGLGDGTFIGLDDTPVDYTASAIPFASATDDELLFSDSFIYDGNRLGVATDDLRSTLTVGGGLSLLDQGTLRLFSTGSTGYVGFRAPSSVASSTIWTLPDEDGTNDQILVTDGAGTLRFDDVSSIGGGATTYLDLLDTPSFFATSSFVFVSEDGDALTQSEDLTFAAGELVLDGAARFLNTGGTAGLSYVRGSGGRLGIGTAPSDDRLTVRGSITQFGGTASDMFTPSEVAALNLPTTSTANANDVDVVGNFAYVVTSFQGDDFHVVDITDPGNPFEIGSLNLPTTALTVTVQGRYAYVGTAASDEVFYVIDISNPLEPVEVASLELDASVNDIFIQGRFAYVAIDSVTGSDELFVVDISNPLAPHVVASVDLAASARAVELAGGFAYVGSASQNDDFHVIDISDPLTPFEVGSIDLPTGVRDVKVRGNFAFLALTDTDNGFTVIDITDPTMPTVASSASLPAVGNALDLAGRYAYVVSASSGNDIHIFDVQDPTTPVEVGSRSLASGDALGVRVSGRYAYVTTASAGDTFHVMDITGAELQSAVVHSLQGGALSVSGDGVVAGRVQAGLGLRAGAEGVQTDGSISALGEGSSYIAGWLGVGTSTPSSQLTVAGTIRSTDLAGGTTASLETDAQGNIIREASDERLKRNITDIDGALEIVLQLRGVRYEWQDTERFGSAPSIGFIAQEVDRVVPEAVQQHEDYWSLSPARLVAVVVEAVKELWAEVRGTQQEVESLERRVQELEWRLDSSQSSTDGRSSSQSREDSTSNAASATDVIGTSTDSTDESTATSSDATEHESATTTEETAASSQDTTEKSSATAPSSTGENSSDTEVDDDAQEIGEDAEGGEGGDFDLGPSEGDETVTSPTSAQDTTSATSTGQES